MSKSLPASSLSSGSSSGASAFSTANAYSNASAVGNDLQRRLGLLQRKLSAVPPPVPPPGVRVNEQLDDLLLVRLARRLSLYDPAAAFTVVHHASSPLLSAASATTAAAAAAASPPLTAASPTAHLHPLLIADPTVDAKRAPVPQSPSVGVTYQMTPHNHANSSSGGGSDSGSFDVGGGSGEAAEVILCHFTNPPARLQSGSGSSGGGSDSHKKMNSADPTRDCLVLTSRRFVSIENDAIAAEVSLLSPYSLTVTSGESKPPTASASASSGGGGGAAVMTFVISNSDTAANASSVSGSSSGSPSSHSLASASSLSSGSSSAGSVGSGSAVISIRSSSLVTALFFENALQYFSQRAVLDSCVRALDADMDSVDMMHSQLGAWTELTKNSLSSLIFDPLRIPIYTDTVKMLLLKLKADVTELTKVQLLEFQLPNSVDEAPTLAMQRYQLVGKYNEYTFQIVWSAPSFFVKLELHGRKLGLDFELILVVRGLRVAGTVRMRSPTVNPAHMSISFTELPHISIGVSSQVKVGALQLPFQRAIEAKLAERITQRLQLFVREKMVDQKWLVIHKRAKTELDIIMTRRKRIESEAKLKYDGADDLSMMALTRDVLRDTEQSLKQSLSDVQTQRALLEQFIDDAGQHPPNANATAAARADHKSGGTTRGAPLSPMKPHIAPTINTAPASPLPKTSLPTPRSGGGGQAITSPSGASGAFPSHGYSSIENFYSEFVDTASLTPTTAASGAAHPKTPKHTRSNSGAAAASPSAAAAASVNGAGARHIGSAPSTVNESEFEAAFDARGTGAGSGYGASAAAAALSSGGGGGGGGASSAGVQYALPKPKF